MGYQELKTLLNRHELYLCLLRNYPYEMIARLANEINQEYSRFHLREKDANALSIQLSDIFEKTSTPEIADMLAQLIMKRLKDHKNLGDTIVKHAHDVTPALWLDAFNTLIEYLKHPPPASPAP